MFVVWGLGKHKLIHAATSSIYEIFVGRWRSIFTSLLVHGYVVCIVWLFSYWSEVFSILAFSKFQGYSLSWSSHDVRLEMAHVRFSLTARPHILGVPSVSSYPIATMRKAIIRFCWSGLGAGWRQPTFSYRVAFVLYGGLASQTCRDIEHLAR